MKYFPIIVATCIFLTNLATAHEFQKENHKRPNYIQQIKFDNQLNQKLDLTEEQQEQLRNNRNAFRKEMSKIIKEMEELHDKIRNVYYSGIPKFQADLKTASMKGELVMLKQKADKLKQEHRKNFLNVLNEEQKAEFIKLKNQKYVNQKK